MSKKHKKKSTYYRHEDSAEENVNSNEQELLEEESNNQEALESSEAGDNAVENEPQEGETNNAEPVEPASEENADSTLAEPASEENAGAALEEENAETVLEENASLEASAEPTLEEENAEPALEENASLEASEEPALEEQPQEENADSTLAEPALEENAEEILQEEVSEEASKEEESIKEEQQIEEPVVADDGELKAAKYLLSSNYFSNKELQKVFISDFSKDNPNLEGLYNLIVSSKRLENNYDILGLLYYFAAECNESIKDRMYNELSDKDFNCIYFYACKYAIRFNHEGMYKELTSLIRANDNRSIYLQIIQSYHKADVDTFEEDDRSYKIGCKLAGLLKSRGKKLQTNEFNALYLAVIEAYGNPYNENINKGMKLYKMFAGQLEEELKNYTLLLFGVNYATHYEFDKARDMFTKLSTDSKNWFLVYKNLLLVNNKVRTYEELIMQKKFKELEEYKRLENTSMESNDIAVIERFEEFKKELESITDTKKDHLFATIRKSVYVFGFVFYFLTFMVNYYINVIGLTIIEILCGLAIMGITLLRTDIFKNIKKYLVPLIVYGVIGLLLIILAIIF